MELCPKRKILILALSACIIFPVFFTGALAVAEMDHTCTAQEGGCRKTKEENCSPCLQIEAARYFLKNLRPTLLVSSYTMPLLVSVHISEKYAALNFYSPSPVELKIRFNT
jgi:ABC-type maltose transport system permease subunit